MTKRFWLGGHFYEGADPVCCEKCPCKQPSLRKWRVLVNGAAYDPTSENDYQVIGFYRWKLVAWLASKLFLRKHPMGAAWVQFRHDLPKARLLNAE